MRLLGEAANGGFRADAVVGRDRQRPRPRLRARRDVEPHQLLARGVDVDLLVRMTRARVPAVVVQVVVRARRQLGSERRAVEDKRRRRAAAPVLDRQQRVVRVPRLLLRVDVARVATPHAGDLAERQAGVVPDPHHLRAERGLQGGEQVERADRRRHLEHERRVGEEVRLAVRFAGRAGRRGRQAGAERRRGFEAAPGRCRGQELRRDQCGQKACGTQGGRHQWESSVGKGPARGAPAGREAASLSA